MFCTLAREQVSAISVRCILDTFCLFCLFVLIVCSRTNLWLEHNDLVVMQLQLQKPVSMYFHFLVC